MKKIVLLPLDERPCNSDFVVRLFNHDSIEIVKPKELGHYKEPADYDEIRTFLLKECQDADALIISLDMLLYGGIVPSRLHHEKLETLLSRMDTIRKIRNSNPNIMIYAFQCVMRCPNDSSSEEEPDYYDHFGLKIHDLGVAVHKARMGENKSRVISLLREQIDYSALEDYISRRDLNLRLNLNTLDFLMDHTIDALVIPRDDSTEFGYPAMDEEIIRERISEIDISDRVLIYPGADEVALTLLSRIVNRLNVGKPKVYIKYASDSSGEIIPLYEGNALATTIRYHVLSAGCQMTESYEQADIILVVLAPSSGMIEAEYQPSTSPSYCVDRLLVELIEFIQDRITEGKIVTIADDAYANGGDLEFLHLMNKADLIMKVDGYAGWNTNSNTLGTALAEAVDSYYFGKSKQHNNFLVERYLEDGGYCALVRWQVSKGLSSVDVGCILDSRKEEQAVEEIYMGLKCFLNKTLSSIAGETKITKLLLPWHRMFEVNLEAEYLERQ